MDDAVELQDLQPNTVGDEVFGGCPSTIDMAAVFGGDERANETFRRSTMEMTSLIGPSQVLCEIQLIPMRFLFILYEKWSVLIESTVITTSSK